MVRVGKWNLSSPSENGGVCEELRKTMVDVRCLQMRWKGQGARMQEMKGRAYKLWWSRKGDGIDGMGVMVNELCEKVVEVRWVSDRVMTVVIVFKGVC